MAYEYTQMIHHCTTLTIPASVHHLQWAMIQPIMYTFHPEKNCLSLTPDAIKHCAYDPPDYTILVTFHEPCTGLLYIHEHPSLRLQYGMNRLLAEFRES